MIASQQAIGVFDSGIGGLTVLNVLLKQLPNERYIYLGDTAHLPYGTKSQETVIRYSIAATEHLVKQGIKMLVVACNTASTLALPALKAAFPELPMVGVLEPGARAAVEATKNNHIAVIATDATIRSEGYQKRLFALSPEVQIEARSTSLFVALAEEGWMKDSIALSVAKRYLTPMFSTANYPDTLILGCTHFPLLQGAIARSIPDDVMIVDSADATAKQVHRVLDQLSAFRESAELHPEPQYFVTDHPERFQRIAQFFMTSPVVPEIAPVIT